MASSSVSLVYVWSSGIGSVCRACSVSSCASIDSFELGLITSTAVRGPSIGGRCFSASAILPATTSPCSLKRCSTTMVACAVAYRDVNICDPRTCIPSQKNFVNQRRRLASPSQTASPASSVKRSRSSEPSARNHVRSRLTAGRSSTRHGCAPASSNAFTLPTFPCASASPSGVPENWARRIAAQICALNSSTVAAILAAASGAMRPLDG
mmetsp:Transcript_35144/g.91966  ORF Transcript_35144/g.91966 Transcript_35144/m.91966 type:complete len:210 (-) Transcript_35144:1760-2389(-)